MIEDKQVFVLLGKPVTAYALCVTVSVLAGLILFARLAAKRKCRPDTAVWFPLFALPMGLVGARLFYCLARLSLYLEIGLENVLYLWQGGYMLWGAVAGCALAAVCTAKMTGQKTVTVTDVAAAPAALVIALCRFSEYFSGEGIGMLVENEAFWHFPLAVCNEYEEWYWSVFLLEGLAALVIMLLVCRPQPQGDATKHFLLLYSVCQILLESLRRDNFPRWLFVRVSQLIAALVVAGMLLRATLLSGRNGRPRVPVKRLALAWAGFVICIGLIVALEFAVDKSAELPVWLCYLMEALCCAGILAVTYPVIMQRKESESGTP